MKISNLSFSIRCVFSILIATVILTELSSQSWDYVKYYNTSSYNTSGGAVADDLGNIYSLEIGNTISSGTHINCEYRLSKYDVNGSYINSIVLPINSIFNGKPSCISPHKFINMVYENGNIYLLAKTYNHTKGIIYKVDINLITVSIVDDITSNVTGQIELEGLAVKNGELYLTGSYYTAMISDVRFGASTTILRYSQDGAFIAKYSLISNSWIWATKVENIGAGNYLGSIEVSNNGYAYVCGRYTTMRLYENSINFHDFRSNTPKTFLFRINNNTGYYDAIWGVKDNQNIGQDDVVISNTNQEVFWISDNTLHSNNLNSGVANWSKVLPHSINQISLNNCGIYVSSNEASYRINTNTKNIDWSTSSVGGTFKGTSILPLSLPGFSEKVIIVGGWNKNGATFKLDGYSGNTSNNKGIVIGRVNDLILNQCCGLTSTANANFVTSYRIDKENSKYGLIDVHVLCLSDALLVDGSVSTCESRYKIRLSEFNLMPWTDNRILYNDWIAPFTQAPNNIKITDYLPQGYQLRPNKIYKFSLAVGFPWDIVDLWFKIDCCDSTGVISDGRTNDKRKLKDGLKPKMNDN